MDHGFERGFSVIRASSIHGTEDTEMNALDKKLRSVCALYTSPHLSARFYSLQEVPHH